MRRKKVKLQKMTQKDLSDSEDDDEGSTVDAVTEALYEKRFLRMILLCIM